MLLPETQQLNRADQNIFSCLVIKYDSTWKGGFDILMLIISCYNIFGNAYYSAFGVTDALWFNILDQAVESLFLLDMAFCFCQEYLDEETYTVVTDIKTIAKHYTKRSFIFDLLAWLPLEMIFQNRALNTADDPARLSRLLKLLRLPRLA